MKPQNRQRFIILVPHRDALKSLEEYREKLFAAGHLGVYSFPQAAPLAAVSRPFSRDELKELSLNIRVLTAESDGKIYCGGKTSAVDIGLKPRRQGEKTAKLSFFGPVLSLTTCEEMFSKTARKKLLQISRPLVICAAILDSGEKPVPGEGPRVSFRAASVANLSIRPLDEGECSFEWRIDPGVWLPKFKGK